MEHGLVGAADDEHAVVLVAAMLARARDGAPRRIDEPVACAVAQLDRVDAGADAEIGVPRRTGALHRDRLLPARQLAAQLERADRPVESRGHRHPRGAVVEAALGHAPARMRSTVRRGVPSGGRTYATWPWSSADAVQCLPAASARARKPAAMSWRCRDV